MAQPKKSTKSKLGVRVTLVGEAKDIVKEEQKKYKKKKQIRGKNKIINLLLVELSQLRNSTAQVRIA